MGGGGEPTGEPPRTLLHKVRLEVKRKLSSRDLAVGLTASLAWHRSQAAWCALTRAVYLGTGTAVQTLGFFALLLWYLHAGLLVALDGRLEYHYSFGIPCPYLGTYDPRHAWVSRVYAVCGARLPMGVFAPYGA